MSIHQMHKLVKRSLPGIVVKLLAFGLRDRGFDDNNLQEKLLTRTNCDEVVDYVVPNVLSPRDLVLNSNQQAIMPV